jgi:hypothetical protein
VLSQDLWCSCDRFWELALKNSSDTGVELLSAAPQQSAVCGVPH